MRLKKINTVLGLMLIVLCIAAGTWGIIRQKTLKNKHKVCVAYVYKYTAGGRGNAGGIWIDYIIEVNGKTYSGSSLYRMSDVSSSTVERYVLHKTLPAIYNPANPSLSSLMIIPRDFNNNGYTFPDSLSWLLPYFKQQ